MRPICWLHISDIHIQPRDAWSQDIVLTAMCRDIDQRRRQGITPDFILVTGDLAFSGAANEYHLVKDFFDALIEASGVPRERIFCIPGNHDIERERERLSFAGARATLQSQNHIDPLLAPRDDLRTLLRRQENYRKFQDFYFEKQDKTWTSDGLGYVAALSVNEVRLAIVALDSAWLAEGGISDHGKLLVGERQVVNALALARTFNPHIVVGMVHHPLHLLQDFDRRPIQRQIETECHFFHCGHLHEVEAHKVVTGGVGCLTLAAGASFETRQTRNSYSVVTLDLIRARRTVTTIQYEPTARAFPFASAEEYSLEVASSGTCPLGELAQAIVTHSPSLSWLAHYLSALLLDQKADILIPTQQGGHTFGSYPVLEAQPDGELKRSTMAFMGFKNLFRVFYNRTSLQDLFDRYGDSVRQYGAALEELGRAHPELKTRLAEQETDAQAMVGVKPSGPFAFTASLLAELADSRDWDTLRSHALRHVESPDSALQAKAIQMLALSLAHSTEQADKATAIEMYRGLVNNGSAETSDVCVLATLLAANDEYAEAKQVIQGGLVRPGPKATLIEIGFKIVEATGDRAFRKQLQNVGAERPL
jgi:hypothetical protein